MSLTEAETDVHTEHCCLAHGCKYDMGFKDDEAKCTVMSKQKPQSFPCELCDHVVRDFLEAKAAMAAMRNVLPEAMVDSVTRRVLHEMAQERAEL